MPESAPGTTSGETGLPVTISYLYQVEDTPPSGDLPIYRLVLTQENWTELTTRDLFSNVLLDATFVYEGEVFYNVGVRYRGECSRPSWPRPYRIKFRDEHEFEDRERINDSILRHTQASNAVIADYNSTLYLLRNEIYDIESDAVHATGGYAFIQGNHIYDIRRSLYPLEGIEISHMTTPAVLLDNHIHDVSDDCMDLNHSSAVIERNELHHCGDKGISIGHPSSTTLVNNLVYACNDGAVSYIVNNTVADNLENGIWLYEVQLPGHYGLGAGFATVVNTIVWGNGTEIGLDLEHGAVITVTYSDVRGDSVWPGEENINTDPLFRAPQSGIYRLLEGSPCVDTGMREGAPDEDVRGVYRPHGEGYDRGAHEFLEYISCYLPLILRLH